MKAFQTPSQELMGGKFGEMSTLVYIPEHKNA